MSRTLEIAIERLRQMPEDCQERLAHFLLHELEEDERWQLSTAQHAQKLPSLVAEILEAERRGECETLDVDKL